MGVLILLLLVIAAVLGILGAVIRVALVLVLGLTLGVAILIWGTIWYLRYRIDRFSREMQRQMDEQARRDRAYPTEGSIRDDDPGALPG